MMLLMQQTVEDREMIETNEEENKIMLRHSDFSNKVCLITGGILF